jgi:hypothetical protein
MTLAGGGRMGRFLGAAESAACVTEQKLELNSGNVAGAAGKGRYVGVPTSLPRGEKSLGGETDREPYGASGARSFWRLGWCGWFRWSASGLGWWAVGVVLSPFQYVGGLHSVS